MKITCVNEIFSTTIKEKLGLGFLLSLWKFMDVHESLSALRACINSPKKLRRWRVKIQKRGLCKNKSDPL